MSLFDLIETDPWPMLKPKIMRERENRLEDLRHAPTWEGFQRQNGFIEALDWVIAEAKPKAPPREAEDE